MEWQKLSKQISRVMGLTSAIALSVRSINIRLRFSAAYSHASFKPYYVLLWSTYFLPFP